MNEKIIYIELFQPFAQYRNPFTFYYAQSYPLPPKSTVIGMLQNATDRYYDLEFWKLRVSIHGGFESLFWNYQQLIKGYVVVDSNLRVKNQGKPLYNEGFKAQRTPVYQQELFNGHLYLFIKGPKEIVDEIHSALERPNKILSLGRSEDVVYIRKVLDIDPKNIETKTVKKNIWLTYPTYIRLKANGKRFPIKNEKFPVYSIPIRVEFWNDGKTIKNKAEINKKTERKVQFETVIYTGLDYVVYLSEEVEIEIFKLNLNGKKLIFKIPLDFGWL